MQRFPFITHPRGESTHLILVRHGQTDGNVSLRLHGRTDTPLNDLGHRQAERTARQIAELFTVDAVVSSPLQRAHQTANYIGAAVHLEPFVDAGLLEMDFGDLEGVSVETFLASYPDLARKVFDPENSDLQWPNGESRSGFHRRVRDAFDNLAVRFSGQTAVAVSHNGVLGSYLAQVQGNSPDNWQAFRIANCALTSVEIGPEGATLHLLNSCDHLDGMVTELTVDPRRKS
jgi:broad specificity phosphatase PhoE